MTAPILLVCYENNLPTVDALNGELEKLGYLTRLAEDTLWPGRAHGALSIVREGKSSTLHLARRSVREECKYLARILSKVAPQEPTEVVAQALDIESRFGNQLVETCYSWDDNGLAVAETHHAFVKAASARLWKPADRVCSTDVLSNVDTENELANSVEYQREQSINFHTKPFELPRLAGTPSSFLEFSKKQDAQNP